MTGRKSEDSASGEVVRKTTGKDRKSSGNATPVTVVKEILPDTSEEGSPGQDKRPFPLVTGKAGRPIWSGNLTIGLVNVPIKLHTMVRDRSFSFRLLHREDGQPLRYERVCTRDGNVIPWQDTVRGYEVRKGEYVVIEPEELKAFLPESDRKIRIEKFVYYLSLDPVYFETPYILTPDRSEDAYNLLATALQESGRAAVGTITLRTKEYPVVVHVYQGALVLTTLRYADEVTVPHSFGELLDLPAPKDAELARYGDEPSSGIQFPPAPAEVRGSLSCVMFGMPIFSAGQEREYQEKAPQRKVPRHMGFDDLPGTIQCVAAELVAEGIHSPREIHAKRET